MFPPIIYIILAPATVAITEHDITTSQQIKTPPITTTSAVTDLIVPLVTTTKGEYFYDIVMYKLS